MLTEQRKRHLLAVLAQMGRIVAKDVAAELGLSEDTIRRDLRELASEGQLQRVHGGALPTSPATGTLETRREIFPTEKIAIGRHAATMVLPGQTIFIDGGTTAIQLANHLDRDMRATIVTHSPLVAAALAGHAVDVILLGGRLFKHSMVTMGVVTLQAIRDIRPDIFFMGVTGVHPLEGLTTGDSEEAGIKRAIADISAELVVMASSEKIGAASPFVIASVDRADVLIIPSSASGDVADRLATLGIDVRRV
ncbi:MAG: DeoR/GlpR family DNA-binding transcription regulator [Pseudomonadota bacterium]|uniref:DeoR/GlpR family DNA-binding transcription regulator n=1 Tax=Sphingomonas sp. ERG5 TaxID=1381597 RepID=UPI00054BA596|nr:DeoR/GlpR family DNA-binding transcription regulator [Sphingomonas sp. ERG5]